ncbi:MAG TPA: DUF6249 domain-containing protein [Candidatus Binatia bacterium]|nr:DUF6249 domain-containing protein [Candidatus Binatia bacterium]
MTDYSDIIPLVAIIVIFGAPIAAFIVSRVFAHQERMEMLRRGIVPPPNWREMRRAMKYGWAPGAMPQGQPNQYGFEHDFYAQQQLRRGIQVACIGFALLIGLGFIGYHGDGRYVYGPWLLGGLIPLFVGIAQIIGAVLSGASFGPPAARQSFGPSSGAPGAPTSAAGSAPPPGPTYGGWRPGPTPEIEKPASPPDYRS